VSPTRHYRRVRPGTVVIVITVGLGLPAFVALCVMVVALAGATR
jgi:hypothetical protein